MEIPTKQQVRDARQAAGLTQTQAAALVDCKLRAWQNWESEKIDVNMPANLWRLFRLSTETTALKRLKLS